MITTSFNISDDAYKRIKYAANMQNRSLSNFLDTLILKEVPAIELAEKLKRLNHRGNNT
jgi:predicted CopG family antitoxin